YQGRANMVPTAVSQVIEAMGKLFVGLGLAWYAVQQGMDDPQTAAMAVLGVTIGEAVAAAYMLVQAAITRRRSETVRVHQHIRRCNGFADRNAEHCHCGGYAGAGSDHPPAQRDGARAQ